MSQRAATAESAGRHGIDDDVAQVGAERRVEAAAAGDQAQLGVRDRAVYLRRREVILEVSTHRRHAEDGQRPVGPPYVEEVPRAQLVQPEENARPAVGVDMTSDDGRADGRSEERRVGK